ncbi:MAG: type II toxin-antitoxin system RelE/ParE family toxin [Bacteroidales bacterium]|nr:type II toxin-antitoxin system RelE/ParE family toxin [Bacteroidales bacterium]
MRIEWYSGAETQKDKIADYIFERFGYNRMEQYLDEVERTVSMLKQYPSLGTIDSLFADRPKVYRSVIIGGLSKMVYRIETDTIHIVAFWDCRQEPEQQAAQAMPEK